MSKNGQLQLQSFIREDRASRFYRCLVITGKPQDHTTYITCHRLDLGNTRTLTDYAQWALLHLAFGDALCNSTFDLNWEFGIHGHRYILYSRQVAWGARHSHGGGHLSI